MFEQTVIFAGKLREAKEARKLELLARETKFGEGLRMSGPAAGRDPLLDEDEEDWVETKILGGWSHGYLQVTFPSSACASGADSFGASQMISLLPEAVHAIDMMADWISDSFHKHEEQQRNKVNPAIKQLTAPPSRFATPPLRSVKSTPVPHNLLPSKPGFTSESDRDDENNVLSFTPKKRRPSASQGGSRGESPAPGSFLGDSSSSPPSLEFPRRPMSLSSSDEGASTLSTTTNPRTPDNRLSPPSLTTFVKGSPSQFGVLATPSPSLPPHVVSPHERAIRESPFTSHTNAKRFFTDAATSGSRRLAESTSDDESGSPSSGSTGLLEPPVATVGGGKSKTSRSGSAGSLPAPLPANFIDAKDLLRLRREEAVFGISLSSSPVPSAVPSDDDDEAKAVGKEK